VDYHKEQPDVYERKQIWKAPLSTMKYIFKSRASYLSHKFFDQYGTFQRKVFFVSEVDYSLSQNFYLMTFVTIDTFPSNIQVEHFSLLE
jgi:hypothetical protein